LQFETPVDKKLTLVSIFLFLLFTMVMWCNSAKAQTSEPPLEEIKVEEDVSTCNRALQIFKGLQLIDWSIDPDTLNSAAIYYRKLADGRILLFRLLRKGCNGAWEDGGIKVLQGPKCVPSESTQCL